MDRQEVLARLCRLQHEVWGVISDGQDAADCFCKEGGFWQGEGTWYKEDDYRNDCVALDFIENATRKALKRDSKDD